MTPAKGTPRPAGQAGQPGDDDFQIERF